MAEYNITGIIGLPRSGKTLLAVHYCYQYYNEFDRPVYSNNYLSFRTGELTMDILRDFPPALNKSVLLADEIHMWSDAYKFFSKDSEVLATLFTQLGKRKIYFIYTTQRFKNIPPRLRDLTNNLIFVTKLPAYDSKGNFINGLAKVEVFDNQGYRGENMLDKFIFDGRRYFKMYDTDEIILPAK